MTRHGLYLGRNASHLCNQTSQRIIMWVFREQTIYVRKQNENVSVYHLCDLCRQPVVVAKTDFGRCSRVVLIDDGYGANFEKLLKGRPCIMAAMLVLHIFTGQ